MRVGVSFTTALLPDYSLCQGYLMVYKSSRTVSVWKISSTQGVWREWPPMGFYNSWNSAVLALLPCLAVLPKLPSAL